jgi:hypothetical protein
MRGLEKKEMPISEFALNHVRFEAAMCPTGCMADCGL